MLHFGFNTTREIAKAIYSDKSLASLYEKRKALRPSEENRSPLSTVLAGLLFALMLGFVISLTWTDSGIDRFINSRVDIKIDKTAMSDWQMSPVHACSVGRDCSNEFNQMPASEWQTVQLAKLPALHFRGDPGEFQIALRKTLSTSGWHELQSLQNPIILGLPAFKFVEANIYINGAPRARFVNDERLKLTLTDGEVSAPEVEVMAILTANAYQPMFNLGDGEATDLVKQSISVMPFTQSQEYDGMVAMDRMGRGDVLGRLARVVMSIFVLALFLIVDGSAETLGLSLFMGFEALALLASYSWIPGIPSQFLSHFAFQMGDIFRLYFFLQMARMIDKNIRPWLFWGVMLSIPYGLLRQYGTDASFFWVEYIPRARDLFVGMVGTIVCMRSAIYIRDKQLPWRVAALLVAAIGSFEQMIEPLGLFIPVAKNIPYFIAFQDAMQPLSAWLLAFSAFINISTLENRVKTLSQVAVDARELEAEMELAQAVQSAFQQIPELPDGLQVACFNEAMMYVSGDTYFVDWNEQHYRLTFMITDVTGHGVQAALKASGVSVLANSVWNNADEKEWGAEKIVRYAAMVHEFFVRTATFADIVAIGGAEFNARTGLIKMYRQNFPFPILITPRQQGDDTEARWDDVWVIKLLALANAAEVEMQLTPGTFVVFTSDGFMESSRSANEFVKHLRKHLAKAERGISADQVRDLVLTCQSFINSRGDDDRTVTVFQWQKAEVKSRVGKPLTLVA